jgi:deoxyadenosine/deoxycytidine kinase
LLQRLPEAPTYKFISIEGNIGTGKTSFCHRFARESNSKLVLEGFSDNPFLSKFYENPKRYAFSVELFFMTERHKQMQEAFGSMDLFQQSIISDYCFPKTLIFAKNNLTEDEFHLFLRIYKVLFNQFPNPSILVYLHRSVPSLLELIKQRARSYEANITAEYLKSIQDAYFEFFKGITNFPIVIIDVENMDFVNSEKDYTSIRSLLNRTYLPGVHRISLMG